jgi:hypothetical protein
MYRKCREAWHLDKKGEQAEEIGYECHGKPVKGFANRDQ